MINAAGASQATFYRRFTTKQAFLGAVLAELRAASPVTTDDVRAEVSEQLARPAGSGRSLVRVLTDRYFEAAADRTEIGKHLLAHVLAAGDVNTARAVRAQLRHRDELMLAGMEVAFGRSGNSLRAPFTVKSLATALTAVIDGFRIRANVDPATVTSGLVADTLSALLHGAVAAADQQERLEDVLAPRTQDPATGALPREPRAAVLAAARAEFGARGYFAADMTAIAARAGVLVSAVRTLFPNKPQLIIGALRGHVAILSEAVDDDVLLGLDEITVLGNHLLRLAKLTATETEFMDALLVALAHDNRGETDGLLSLREEVNLPAIIAPTLAEAQRKGSIGRLAEPDELAATVTNILLHRCFSRRTISPEENTALVLELLLHGLAGRD